LALEHLREQLAKEKPEVLERLGWTKDDARRFLDRWELMKQAAGKQGPAGTAARQQFDDALRSLGLRPRGTELRHGGIQTDQLQKLRDAGRFAPPPEWAEQFREYTRGVAGGGR
jgi:collagen type III alpha